MRATKLGRWAGRAAVVLVLGLGAATMGAGPASADFQWDSTTPTQTDTLRDGQTDPVVTPLDFEWD